MSQLYDYIGQTIRISATVKKFAWGSNIFGAYRTMIVEDLFCVDDGVFIGGRRSLHFQAPAKRAGIRPGDRIEFTAAIKEDNEGEGYCAITRMRDFRRLSND